MALPRIDVPTQHITLPSSGKEIIIRPFLVKEEKILLTALAAEDAKEIVNATKQIVTNCVLSNDFDVDALPIYELEYLIIRLRAISIGEKLSLKFSPLKNTPCEECQKQRDVSIDISQVKIVFPEGHERKIELTDNIGIVLKDPEAKIMSEFEAAKQSKEVDDLLKIIWKCVDYVYDKDNITSPKDVTTEEGLAFLESLKSDQFKKIDTYFQTIPRLNLVVPIKCSSCDYTDEYVLEKLEDFFG
jgi:hypothetical protein